MANDREQKIRDVYEAMIAARKRKFPGSPNPREGSSIHTSYMRHARAAVDVLDPVTRIELSGGFHAEPPERVGEMTKIFVAHEGGMRAYVGMLSKAAVEAWAAAAAAKSETDHARDEVIENLKQRIAALGKILEAVTPNALNPSAIDTDGTPRT